MLVTNCIPECGYVEYLLVIGMIETDPCWWVMTKVWMLMILNSKLAKEPVWPYVGLSLHLCL